MFSLKLVFCLFTVLWNSSLPLNKNLFEEFSVLLALNLGWLVNVFDFFIVENFEDDFLGSDGEKIRFWGGDSSFSEVCFIDAFEIIERFFIVFLLLFPRDFLDKDFGSIRSSVCKFSLFIKIWPQCRHFVNCLSPLRIHVYSALSLLIYSIKLTLAWWICLLDIRFFA